MTGNPLPLAFRCPACQRYNRTEVSDSCEGLKCAHCGWSRPLRQVDPNDGRSAKCLVCGCSDLWRQKDFSQRLGMLAVGIAVVLSTIAAAYYRPVTAMGILMAFALADLLLYALMPDVLVCYRCGSRCRHANLDEDHPRFRLELHERYRQEAKRLEGSANAES